MKKACVMTTWMVLVMTVTMAVRGNAEEGWVSLFNGKDFSGWVTPKKDHNWKVVDGVIDYESKGGNLVTEKKFEDYVLQLEWRFKRTAGKPYNAKVFNPDGTQKKDANGKPMTQPVKNADSGIFVRGTGQSQVNLWCWPCGSGQLWSYHRSKDPEIVKGALPKVNADKPVGEWNEMEITMRGEKVKVVLNGKLVIDSRMPGIPEKGPIALQHHGGYNEGKKEWNSASALIQFRNIRIKELSKEDEVNEGGKDVAQTGEWKDLFNGKDLNGFAFSIGRKGTENNGTYTVKDGVVICSGKPSGYMYTRKSYSKYTLTYDWKFKRPDELKTNKKFNSGCLIHIKEKNLLGVWPKSIEVQGMHRQAGLILPIPRNVKCKHTFDDEVRKKVVKPLGEWNTNVIDVNGGEMTITINGSVVSTVSDSELTEGPIGFQSEGAEIHFRNIRILEK
ncbi:DUF1080 domain-containing protein [Verrucomicrobiota bacterium]